MAAPDAPLALDAHADTLDHVVRAVARSDFLPQAVRLMLASPEHLHDPELLYRTRGVRGAGGTTLLMHAVSRGDVPRAAGILGSCPTPEARAELLALVDADGKTALHIACSSHQLGEPAALQLAALLLGAGADPLAYCDVGPRRAYDDRVYALHAAAAWSMPLVEQLQAAIVTRFGETEVGALALHYVPTTFVTREICDAALQQDARNVRWVPDALATPAALESWVANDGWVFGYVAAPHKTLELARLALEGDEAILREEWCWAGAEGLHARAQLERALSRCGIRSGPAAALLVHASLSALGTRLPRGADDVIDALLWVLEGGTLLLPTLSYLFVSDAAPRFDAATTPTNLGAIPAAALRRPGALRSLHPTHSCVALGPRAAELCGGHGADRTPVGPGSPFTRLAALGGGAQVAFLGVPHLARCNTSVHGVEEALPSGPPAYLLRAGTVAYEVVAADGAVTVAHHRRHDFRGTLQRYERLVPLLEACPLAPPGSVVRARVLGADAVVMDAGEMWRVATAALARDPGAFTERAAGPTAEEHHHLVASASTPGVFKYTVGPPAGS